MLRLHERHKAILVDLEEHLDEVDRHGILASNKVGKGRPQELGTEDVTQPFPSLVLNLKELLEHLIVEHFQLAGHR